MILVTSRLDAEVIEISVYSKLRAPFWTQNNATIDGYKLTINFFYM